MGSNSFPDDVRLTLDALRAVPEERTAILCPGQGPDLGVDKLMDPKLRAKSLAGLEVGDELRYGSPSAFRLGAW